MGPNAKYTLKKKYIWVTKQDQCTENWGTEADIFRTWLLDILLGIGGHLQTSAKVDLYPISDTELSIPMLA
jgi:hypothetical protein